MKFVVDRGDCLEFDGLETTTNTPLAVAITHSIQNRGFLNTCVVTTSYNRKHNVILAFLKRVPYELSRAELLLFPMTTVNYEFWACLTFRFGMYNKRGNVRIT